MGAALSSDEKYLVFEIESHGREPELNHFSKELNEFKWVSKSVHRLGPDGVAYYGGAPAELIALVLSLTANLLAIAKILAERVSNGKDSLIRIDGKEVRLKGKWKAEEIADIINVVAKRVDKKEAFEKIAQIKSEKIEEAKKELSDVGGFISQYERLVKTFKKLSEKGTEQKKKHAEYKKKLIELKAQADYLNSLISFLQQKND